MEYRPLRLNFLTNKKPQKMDNIKNIMLGVLLGLIVYKLVDTLLLSKIAMFEEEDGSY